MPGPMQRRKKNTESTENGGKLSQIAGLRGEERTIKRGSCRGNFRLFPGARGRRGDCQRDKDQGKGQ